MNEERRLEICRLAMEESHARQMWMMIGMRNCAGLTATQASELNQEYRVAEARWRLALSALQDAVAPDSLARAERSAYATPVSELMRAILAPRSPFDPGR
jgi:hypothetical protein